MKPKKNIDEIFFLILELLQKFTNIDNLGMGYNILLGNPHNDLYDPGFTISVVELTYNEVRLG